MFCKLPLMLLLSQNIPSRIPIVGLFQNYCTSSIIVLFNPLTRKYFDWLVELKEFGMCATTMCMYWVTLAFSYPALLPFTLFTLSQGASYWQLWKFQGTLSILQRQLILFLGGECCLTYWEGQPNGTSCLFLRGLSSRVCHLLSHQHFVGPAHRTKHHKIWLP